MSMAPKSLAIAAMFAVVSSQAGAAPDGARFMVSGSEHDRLELDAGYWWDSVRVPLVRSEAATVGTNILECAGGGSETVEWRFGETQKVVTVTIPLGGEAGDRIPLVLLAADGSTNATSDIVVMEGASGTPLEPWWVGELAPSALPWGEWTFDYDAAQSKVAAEGGALLAMFTGPLWCPDCFRIGDSLLADPAFKKWGRDNKVVFVQFDQARLGRSAPRLLSYEPDPRKSGAESVSGAGYLTRKNVDPDVAAAVIKRTTEFSTRKWLPEGSTASRLGNPTLLFIGSDGNVSSRVSLLETKDGYPAAENIERLAEALKAAGGVMPAPVAVDEGADPVPVMEEFPRLIRMTLPMCAKGDAGVKSMVATLDLKVRSRTKVDAKIVGVNGAKISFRGRLVETGDGGYAVDIVEKGGAKLSLLLSGDGLVAVALLGAAAIPDCESGEMHVNTGGGFGTAWAGYYTVALPVEGASAAATVLLTVRAAGKAKWRAVMPDGKTFSGSCPFAADVFGRAIVPVFCRTGSYKAVFPLMVRPWAAARAKAEPPNYRAVKVVDGVCAEWTPKGGATRRLKAWGSFYSGALDFEYCACSAYGTSNLTFFVNGADASKTVPSGKVITSIADVSIAEKVPGLTFRFNRATGLFSGRFKIVAADGRKSHASYKGVLIPGWHDCGCTPADLASSTPFNIENAYPDADPFALGGAWYRSRVGRNTETAVLSVKID